MGCYMGFKYAKNALAAGASPGPHWGSSQRSLSSRPPSRLGRGTPVPMPHPLGDFGASILVPPWKPGAPGDLELATVLGIRTFYL